MILFTWQYTWIVRAQYAMMLANVLKKRMKGVFHITTVIAPIKREASIAVKVGFLIIVIILFALSRIIVINIAHNIIYLLIYLFI